MQVLNHSHWQDPHQCEPQCEADDSKDVNQQDEHTLGGRLTRDVPNTHTHPRVHT